MEIPFLLVLVVVVLVLFMVEVIAIDLVALAIPIVLVLADILTPMSLLSAEEAVAGFSNRAVVTIAMMFVLSAGLVRTGAVDFVGHRILDAARGREPLAVAYMMGVVAVLSAFINNTPIVVVFLPIVLNLARQLEVSPSRLLIPLGFASIFGGMCTLIGTSTNLVVDGILRSEDRFGVEPLSMFEFAPVGAVLAVAGIAYLLLFGRWLLPSRTTVSSFTGGESLREYVTEVEVGPGSSHVGKRIAETFLASGGKIRVLEVIRAETILWPPFDEVVLEVGDLLLIKGEVGDLVDLHGKEGLALIPELATGELRMATRETTLAELVISPNSRLIGQRVRDVALRQTFGVAVIAVQRRGVHLRRKVSDLVLRFGDILLVQGAVGALRELRHRAEFILLEGVDETVVRSRKAPIALGILGVVILLAGLRLVDILTLSMAGAFLMVATGCVGLRDAYRSVDLRVLVVIVGTLALGHSMAKTGTAEAIVAQVESLVAPLGPRGAISAVFFVTMVLTSLVSNTAAAVLMVPIAVTMAETLGVNARGFVFAVAFGASACFATPLGYQTNMFIYGPGGYRFSDFVRVGLPLNLLFWILATLLIPIVWPFAETS